AAVEGDLAAAFSKLEEAAARFALLHHIVTRVSRGEEILVPVEKDSVEAGILLCLWFAREARRIYSTLSESEDQRKTRRLVEFIRTRGGKISARALQKSNSRKYPKAQFFAAFTSISTVTCSLIRLTASRAETGMATSLNAWAGEWSAT